MFIDIFRTFSKNLRSTKSFFIQNLEFFDRILKDPSMASDPHNRSQRPADDDDEDPVRPLFIYLKLFIIRFDTKYNEMGVYFLRK